MSNLSDRGTLRGSLGRVTDDYNNLINKPSINGHELVGDQGGHELGLANLDDVIYVEANPAEDPSEELTKLRVNDVIYDTAVQIVFGEASGDVASFDDGANNKPLKSLKVAINPVQDLHGYDSPWVGGAGKNKLPLTVDRIKANNTNGTWNGNVYTKNGVTFTLETNEGGNITGIKVNGTASANVYLMLSQNELNYITFDGSYVVSGCSNGSPTTYALQVYSNESSGVRIDNFNEGNYIQSSNSSYTVNSVMIVIRSGYTASNLMFYPMISLSTVSYATFEPYSNICPISGWTGAEIHRADGATPHIIDDTYNITWSEAGEVYGGTLDVTNSKLKARPYYARYNGETLMGPWISSMDVYDPNTPPTTGAQVVDLGGVETEIDISPTQITTLLGNNNIWSDTGEILECGYQRDLNIVINKLLQ